MNTEPGTVAPSEAADSVTYSAQHEEGKGNTLNTLWDKLRKFKTETKTRLTTPDIFNPHSREWLSS